MVFLHCCARCGARIRSHRQSTNAAWYRRHGLEPKAFPIIWVDRGGSQDCGSVQARRERRERGERDTNFGSDARHVVSVDEYSDGTD
jgi:hypothetical protein